MRKYIFIFIFIFSVLKLNVIVYANIDFSEIIKALDKLPYIYELIQSFFTVNGEFSFKLFMFVRMFIEFILCILILSLFKNFVCQSVVIINKEVKRVLFSGIVVYLLIMALLVMFFASFIGFPIAVIILLMGYAFILMGKTAFTLFIGIVINKKFNWNLNVHLNYLLGAVLIELISFIPYIGQFFLLCMIPIISFGILAISLLNKYVYKKYYSIPFKQEISEKKCIREDIRKIILKEIDM